MWYVNQMTDKGFNTIAEYFTLEFALYDIAEWIISDRENDERIEYWIDSDEEEPNDEEKALYYSMTINSINYEGDEEFGRVRDNKVIRWKEFNEELDNYNGSFLSDREKMRDFVRLSREEFLESYSYLDGGDYDATEREMYDTYKRMKDYVYNFEL